VHLYLARRQPGPARQTTDEQPLVAIREIILSGLAPSVRQCVVRAAFEEFAAPQLFGSAHLPGVGDHLYLEGERHYLVMQPRQVRGNTPARAQPLSERQPGPSRLDLSMALHLGTRLCQTVVHLHRLNLHLGELPPALLLIDPLENAYWAPLLLVAWPPAPSFWPGHSQQTARRLAEQIFPSLEPDLPPAEQDSHPFAAPELFTGQRDARSDVYALGAILYLLCTGSVPAPAAQRQRPSQAGLHTARSERQVRQFRRPQPAPQLPVHQDPTLTAPRLLNPEISPLLEQIFLRALALSPEQRFASVRDLAEALESMHLKNELPDTPVLAPPFPRAKTSRLRRLLEWLRR
jgi:serine/threonine protein kinase